MKYETFEKYTPNLSHSLSAFSSTYRSDMIAGLTTATLLIPQSMAYAMLAGLPAEVGLYSAMIPLLLYSIFGSVRELSVGPVAMDSLLVGSALSSMTIVNMAQRVHYASILSILVGLVLLLFGVLKLGKHYHKIGDHLMSAFTTAAALLIIKSQIPSLIGVKQFEISSLFDFAFYQKIHLPTLTLGMATIVLFMLIKHIPKLPSSLVLIASGILMSKLFAFHAQFEIAIVGFIPNDLPSFQMIDLNLMAQSELWTTLVPSAFVIAFVAFMEAIAVNRVMCEKHQETLNANQELISIGISNVGGAFFGGYPVTGGLSRTAFNAQAGAKTAFASMVTVMTVMLALLFLSPLLEDLPKVTLSVLIIFAVSQLIKLSKGVGLWQTNRFESLFWGITLVSTLVLGVQWGLIVGILSEAVAHRIKPNTSPKHSPQNKPI
jgi:SulP family sulfate permease